MASAAPLPPSLLASARAAYRTLLRASAATFKGDALTRNAFLLKMRRETLACPPTAGPQQVQEKIGLAKEIADVLLRNVVQAVQLDEPARGAQDYQRFKLNITEHTELGRNDSIKDPPPIESSRSARKRVSSSDAVKTSDPATQLPRYYSQLKKAAKQRVVPELKEEDLEESFVRGSGPGGQSINKTENNVQLLHKPTGMRVACQDTRSLSQNRKLARRRLLEKLDAYYNPGLSKEGMRAALQRERERRRKKKSKKSKSKTDAKNGEDEDAVD
ncbi:RF-1 domain-containing protein [Fomitopsis betulina]|nr:RF-1 domain-containing protein [Fomitopsis betulina]